MIELNITISLCLMHICGIFTEHISRYITIFLYNFCIFPRILRTLRTLIIIFLVYGNSNSVRSIHGIFLCFSRYNICIIGNRFPLFVWKNSTYFYSRLMLFNQFRRHFYWAISHAYYFIFKFFVIKYLLENNKTLILLYLCKFFLNGSIKHFYCIKY